MSADTNIEWCHATVNWWAGCNKVSPACDNCYAERMAGRLWGTQWGPGQPRTQFAGAEATLKALDRKAKRLGKPLGVFHNSLSDFFDKEVPVQWRISALRAMVDTPHLIHLLLTKRIGNASEMLETAFRAIHAQREGWANNVPPNIWIGATICSQEEADRDIPKLLAVPAAKRFLSMEPLLGPVNLGAWIEPWNECGYCGESFDFEQDRADLCPGCGQTGCMCTGFGSKLRSEFDNADGRLEVPDGPGIDWVIVGGESGPNARPMHPDWASSLRDQCVAAGVPYLFKQWGEWAPCEAEMSDECGRFIVHPDEPIMLGERSYATISLHNKDFVKVGKKAAGRLLDGRTWDEVPA